jgi:hypothetical protein
VKHELPGCSDDACCARVCAADPLCCTIGWDNKCVETAELVCNGCGDIEAGSCFWPHGGTGCFDSECCDRVCSIDPLCCTVEWDLFCVLNAGTICLESASSCGTPRSRPCSVASFLPGCEDRECCEVQCVLDPTCCQRAWDETCALAAGISCDIDFSSCPAPGSPLVVHGNPGCANEVCCEAVCAVDPVCCTFGWNERCVDIAKVVCITLETCLPGRDLLQHRLRCRPALLRAVVELDLREPRPHAVRGGPDEPLPLRWQLLRGTPRFRRLQRRGLLHGRLCHRPRVLHRGVGQRLRDDRAQCLLWLP